MLWKVDANVTGDAMCDLAPRSCPQAVSEGHWLLIEDANMAPPDVLAALVPLLEGCSLVLPSRGEVIRAAPSFQLLATVTSAPGSSGGVGGHSTGGAYGSSQMVKVWSKCDVLFHRH